MRTWVVEDEINLQKWVDSKGFSIVYLPQECEWGFVHKDKPNEVNGGFPNLSDLKQHFVKLKGDKANVQVVSQAELQQELERAGMLPLVH